MLRRSAFLISILLPIAFIINDQNETPLVYQKDLVAIELTPTSYYEFQCGKGGQGSELYSKEYNSKFRIWCEARSFFDEEKFKENLDSTFVAKIESADRELLDQSIKGIPLYSLVLNQKEYLDEVALIEAANDRFPDNYILFATLSLLFINSLLFIIWRERKLKKNSQKLGLVQ